MSQLIVRHLDEAIVAELKRRAARHGRSAEAEHREILRAALAEGLDRPSFKAFLASMPEVGEEGDFSVPRDLPREARL
jgi:plasmid stability protein